MTTATAEPGPAPAPVDPEDRPSAVRNDVGALVGARMVIAALGWAGTLLVVRHLDATSWGEFSLVFTLLGLLLIFTSAVGTRSAVRGYLDHDDRARFVGSYIILRFVLGLAGYAAALTFVVAAHYPATVERATALGGLVVVISSVSNGYELIFALGQRLYRVALAQAAGQAVQFALTLGLAALGTGVVGFTVPAIVCEVVILAVVVASVGRTGAIRYRVILSSWGSLARAAIPLAAGQAFFTLAYTVDSVILSRLQPFTAVGVYGIAYKFAGVAIMIPVAVSLAVTGRLVAAWPDHPDRFWRTLRQATTALVVAAALITTQFTVFARPLIGLLYGQTYAVGADAAALVVGGACLSFFTSLAITALTAQGRNTWYPVAGAVGLALNVGLNLWLIPRHSYLAAAWVTVITEVVVLAILLPLLLRARLRSVVDLRAATLTVACALASGLLGRQLASVTAWPVASVVSAGLFVLAIHRLQVPGPRGLRSLLDTDGRGAGARAEAGGPGDVVRRLVVGHAAWALAVAGAGVVVVATVAGQPVVVLALAVVVPAVVWGVRRPQRGVLLLAAAVPFDGLLPLVSNSGVVRSWKEAVVIGLLAATFVSPAATRHRGRRPAVTWAVPLALLMAYSVATLPAFGLHAGLTGFRIEYFYVLVPVVVWRCPLTSGDLDRLVTILMVDAAVAAVYGLAQEGLGAARLHALGYPYNTTIRFTGSHLRAFSSFAQPFPFAYFLMMVMLLGLAVSLADPSRTRNRWFLASLPLLGAGMLFAFVRGAWLGLAVGVAYLVVRRYRRLILAGPLLVLAVLLAVLLGPSSISGSVFQSHSLGQRTSGWSQNLSRVESAPLGRGLGSSGAAAEVLATSAATVAATTSFVSAPTTYQPDNAYYNVLYELGLPGAWLFVVFLLQALGDTDRRARRLLPSSALTLGVAAFVLAALTASLVSTFFEIFPLNVYFYLLLGVVVSQPPADQPAGEDGPSTAALTPTRLLAPVRR